jgi:hypothetical protein
MMNCKEWDLLGELGIDERIIIKLLWVSEDMTQWQATVKTVMSL